MCLESGVWTLHDDCLRHALFFLDNLLLDTMASAFPDYYELLGIQSSADQDEVRQAYKRESLRTHPDRLVNASPEEKRRATEKFQVRHSSLSPLPPLLRYHQQRTKSLIN